MTDKIYAPPKPHRLQENLLQREKTNREVGLPKDTYWAGENVTECAVCGWYNNGRWRVTRKANTNGPHWSQTYCRTIGCPDGKPQEEDQ